jgi:tryptophan synthase alpha chain
MKPVLTIEAALGRRLAIGRKALVPFLTANFPDRRTFVALLRAFEQCECDAVEVGLPFSDPIADGPTIQFASEASLRRGTTIAMALQGIVSARIATPVILMGYLNPILAYGLLPFVRDARFVGVRGVIIPDLPSLEPAPGDDHLNLRPLTDGWERILLATPNTTPARLRAIGRATRGFLYAVTVTGVTGARLTLPPETLRFLRRARQATQRPVLAGFGIADAASATRVAQACDGVIVGSALIERLRSGPAARAVQRARSFLKSLRKAL